MGRGGVQWCRVWFMVMSGSTEVVQSSGAGQMELERGRQPPWRIVGSGNTPTRPSASPCGEQSNYIRGSSK
eukprot:CAMPEP_0174906498 /NCGR_PEP_ID=MMETSP0167-20121228/57383_1 /TAXON_ID=38298 /ORGANISM="Rhodella maculata, Strain CCMP736" /LENGTH=70 /DNA_ID=CAMNT_0016149747 /DNA_START=97 /DNA_END=306 /DNA_ORIENTATION=+